MLANPSKNNPVQDENRKVNLVKWVDQQVTSIGRVHKRLYPGNYYFDTETHDKHARPTCHSRSLRSFNHSIDPTHSSCVLSKKCTYTTKKTAKKQYVRVLISCMFMSDQCWSSCSTAVLGGQHSTRDRSIPPCLQRWVSTKSSISQLTLFHLIIIKVKQTMGFQIYPEARIDVLGPTETEKTARGREPCRGHSVVCLL